MRKLTIKLRITLLYTFFMTILTLAALLILFSLSSREVLTSTRAKLEKEVQESLEELSVREGEIRVDSGFYSVEENIYLSLYDRDGYFLYGKIPYGFDQRPPFEDGNIRQMKEQEKKWYVYDLSFRLSQEDTVYIRGITSITEAEEDFYITLRFALLSLPMILLITILAGYYFTSRTLSPVKEITNTVRQIRKDANLSRRIGFAGEGKKDEIYTLAETFDDMLEELERVFKREKQFTSDVSHELRTPVSVILAQCSVLSEDETLSPKQAEQVRLIQRKAGNMSKMIGELLFLSRVEEGRQKIHKERLNISELTEMAVEEQKLLAEENDTPRIFQTQIEPDVYGEVDETLYIRLLVNLLDNAVYYGKERGIVKVELERRKEALVGSVEDDGVGMTPEQLEQIWKRFYRADTSRTGAERSGLGLPMVKWIVEAHGGEIHVESEFGVGTRFEFEIPI